MEAYREELSLDPSGRSMIFFQEDSRGPAVFVTPHWNDTCEMLFIRRGSAEQRINAEIFPLSAGDVVLICPGDIHATRTCDPTGCTYDVLTFSGALLAAFGHSWSELSSGISHAKDDSFLRLFDAFAQHTDETLPGWELMTDGLLRLTVALLLRNMGAEKLPARSPLVTAICDYAEYADDLNLEHIADHLGYCPEHLSRRFHQETGIPYRVYCEQLRMRRAVMLLHEAECSIAAIAERLNYSNSSCFIRAFRRTYGITPSAYRRLCQPTGSAHSKEG